MSGCALGPDLLTLGAQEKYYLLSQTDSADGQYMIVKMLQVSENKSLRLIHWVIINPRRFRIAPFQVSPFNMIAHLGNAAEEPIRPSPMQNMSKVIM